MSKYNVDGNLAVFSGLSHELRFTSKLNSILLGKVIQQNPFSAADPGFSRGVATRKGAPTLYLAKICRKLHENKENWTGGTHQTF